MRVAGGGTIIRVVAAAPHRRWRLAARTPTTTPSPDGNVAEFIGLAGSAGGERVRVYRLSEHPIEPGRLGRIFRCSTVMVNVLAEDDQPRDPTKLSPAPPRRLRAGVAAGPRRLRAPHAGAWTPDSSTWRDDEHHHCVAPAVVVIPPPLIHTSQSVGAMHHWLIDVFAPPRLDFSQRPGWVLNADEYPMPESQRAATPISATLGGRRDGGRTARGAGVGGRRRSRRRSACARRCARGWRVGTSLSNTTPGWWSNSIRITGLCTR